jgi:hypothetical protein
MLTNLKSKMMALLIAGVMLGLGGCAGISPTKVPQHISGTADFAYKLARNNSGVLYGAVWNSTFNHDITTVQFACDIIHNSDERCSHPDDYVVGKIVTRSQFLEGNPFIMILMEKDKAIEPCTNYLSNKTCTFVKIQTEKGKLGTVLEIVASPKDADGEKCHWSGGGVGGVVCPGWDSANEVKKFTTLGSTKMALTGVEE